MPPDLVARACGGLHALAARKEATPPARLAALDAILAAAPSCGSYGDLASLARDPAGEIRRAAALVAAAGARARVRPARRDRRRRSERERRSASRPSAASRRALRVAARSDPRRRRPSQRPERWRRRRRQLPPTPSRCSTVSRPPERPPTAPCWMSCGAGRRRPCAIAPSSSVLSRRATTNGSRLVAVDAKIEAEANAEANAELAGAPVAEPAKGDRAASGWPAAPVGSARSPCCRGSSGWRASRSSR